MNNYVHFVLTDTKQSWAQFYNQFVRFENQSFFIWAVKAVRAVREGNLTKAKNSILFNGNQVQRCP